MTRQRHPHRLAVPVALVYALMLVTGLALYTITRSDDPGSLAPLWVGTVGGSALGVFLALRDFRGWVAALVIVGIPCWCAPFAPPPLADENVWLAFIPAALCAYWSLGDRGALAAFWFPTVLWMLTVLDRTTGNAIPDGTGAALLGVLALMLFVFLRVRETRRVGLWSTVGATPLADAKPVAVQKEPPGRQLARASWTLAISAMTFAVTAWVAPKLWHTESFGGDPQPIADLSATDGLPCCPVAWEPETRTRVKEYFDIGRGHDEPAPPHHRGYDCQVCPVQGSDDIAGGAGMPLLGNGQPCTRDDLEAGRCFAAGSVSSGTGGTGFVPSGTPPAVASIDPAPAPAPAPAENPQPAPVPSESPEIAPTPDPSPPAPALQGAEIAPTPAPDPFPTPPPPPVLQQPPPAAAVPSTPPPPLHDAPPKASAHAHRPPPATSAPAILPWIVALLAGGVVFQFLALALRPVRRAIALRHLRRPFWDETVDQRVSNFWQLALIGLRDAGWRTTAHEPPGELAKRVDVAGLASCATILDRARHGIGIDAEDLDRMGAAADTVYRDARSQIRPGARALAWLRWPLA